MFAESVADYQRLQRVTDGQLFAGLANTYAGWERLPKPALF